MGNILRFTLRLILSNILSNIISFDIIHFNIKVLNFCMWFKNGLKAQKLLAQGIALGIMANSKAPYKGKSFKYLVIIKLLPLQGDRFASVFTQGDALG